MKRPLLAIDGGKPVRRKTLGYGRHLIDERDIAAVARVLRSDYLTQGPLVDEFEIAFAKYAGRKHAVAFANGTAALHGAYHAIGLGLGKRLLTSAMTFAATANAARFLGVDVEFADIDETSGLIDPADVERRVRAAKPDAIGVVHYAGSLCDMPALRKIARRAGAVLVEDACHALGATGYGAQAGAFGKVGVFSFHPVKAITTGEGGMVVTDDARLADRMRTFRTHGIVRPPRAVKREGAWYSEMVELGFNYRLTDMQCALGLTQLARYDKRLATRRAIAKMYDRHFAGDADARPLAVPGGTASAYHLYPILIEDGAFAGGRRRVFDALRAEGIGVQVHYVPVNAHPYYRKQGHDPRDTPRAAAFARREISLPIQPGMTDRDFDDVINAFEKVRAGLKR
ncbi:UDP-4-amino-4,6-dideoxy-N-acetyl-beta-L-altrosamine transaminase [bacterium]|nr:UDP-4-amino-4,6-dideoxy-N-acetyl-beta-L-altrosamine transaminase [bacterium]